MGGRKTILIAGASLLLAAASLEATGAGDVIGEATQAVAHKAVDFASGLFGRDSQRGVATVRTSGESRASQGQEHEFEWSGRVAEGQWIEVKGLNGEVVAEAYDGTEVVVFAEKFSRDVDVSEVTVAVYEKSDGILVCAVYPGARGECGADGSGWKGRHTVRVDFTVRVPRGVKFRGATVNGDVETRGEIAQVEASSVNGDVRVESEGAVSASTVNGSIDATVLSANLRGAMELETVNGSITLDLVDQVNADVTASWVNGRFTSDLPFRMEGFRSRRAEGVLGAGGAAIRLSTVNGSIDIH